MGCNNCKQKKGTKKNQKSQKRQNINDPLPEKKTIPLLPGIGPDGEFSGNVLLKLVTFIILIGALPLIFVALLIQVFTAFFIPNFTAKTGVMGVIKRILRKFAAIRKGRELKKREEEFRDNLGYDDLDIYSVEEEGKEITK